MGDPTAFVVLNADIMCDSPLCEFVEFHKKHLGEHSILTTEARIIKIIFYTIVFAILFIKTPLGSLCIL